MKGDTKIGRFFGIDIKLHLSWWFIAIFLSWILATQFFPTYYPEFSNNQNWTVAIISTILLFVSVLLHELSHSFVARIKKIQVHSITLFFFGGVADIESEDMKPLDEFLMAIAGPLFSFLLAGICALIFTNTTNYLIPNAIAYYLFQLNIAIGIFNLVPGYPLDGGRALRAILHHFTKDLRKATRIASWGGKAFAGILMFFGAMQIFNGFYTGVWLIFIGFFLHFVAGLSYEQVIFYDVLSKWKVSQFQVHAKSDIMVKAETNLLKFLQTNLSNKHKTFIVKKNKEPFAILDLPSLKVLRGEDLSKLTIGDVSIPLLKLGTLTSDQSAYVAFKKFLASGSRVLSVKKTMESKKIEGLVFKEQVMNALVRRLKFGIDFSENALGSSSSKITVPTVTRKDLQIATKGLSKIKIKVKKPSKKIVSSKKSKSKQNSKIIKKSKLKEKNSIEHLGDLPMPELPLP